MKRLIIFALCSLITISALSPSLQAAQKWVIEPSIPNYSAQPRGMEAGSFSNPYEATIRQNGKIEISTPFPDSSKPMMAPGQPLNPLEVRPVR
jgi:hypothetical protein